MPSLYAHLCAINRYPNPSHRLMGCIDDLEKIKNYLGNYCENQDLQFICTELKDRQASRQNIIDGFDLFNKAKKDDICVFYFSGHGSFCESPDEFARMDVNRKMESIVCHDSRILEGRDLLDKEIAYLIWKATYEKGESKGIHFVSIMDCCHSGGIIRSESLSDMLVSKNVEEPGRIKNMEDILGHETHQIDTDGNRIPPRGDYIHFAASAASEFSHEVWRADRKGRMGVFTNALIELLDRDGPFLSYRELCERVRLRITQSLGARKLQSPQLILSEASHGDKLWLKNTAAEKASYYTLGYDKRSGGWTINCGTINGLDPAGKPVFVLEDEGQRLQPVEIKSHCTIVKGDEAWNKKRMFRVGLEQELQAKLLFGLRNDMDPAARGPVLDLFKSRSWPFVIDEEAAGDAAYLIQGKDGFLYLTARLIDKPLFEKTAGFDPEALEAFFKRLEQVNTYTKRWNMHHADSELPSNAVTYSLSKVENQDQAGMDNNDTPAVELDGEGPHPFLYIKSKGRWNNPGFRLALSNNTDHRLWVCGLYFNENFGISDAFFPQTMLESGARGDFQEKTKDKTYYTIPLKIHQDDRDEAPFQIRNLIKLLVSTVPFNSAALCQKGIPRAARTKNLRDAGRDSLPSEAGEDSSAPKEDWMTRDIILDVIYPGK